MRRIIFIAFLGIAFWASGVAAQEEAQQFEGFNLEGYAENGEKAWDVKGDTADIYDDTVELSNVDANRYGQQVVNLTSETGTLDKSSGNIHLEKDVVITSQMGGQLLTDSLDWDKEGDLLTTADPVLITDERMTAAGLGLKAQPGLKIAQLNEDVTVRIKTEPKKPDSPVLTITCDGPMEIDQAKNMVIFNENVVAVQTDRTLKADKMEVYFDSAAKGLKEVVCLGNVEIFQDENMTYSQKAVYVAKSKRVILSGSTRMTMITEGEGGVGSLGKD